VPAVDAVLLDGNASRVAIPNGCGIDLGGIAKGAFIDAAVERCARRWPGGCVNAGGDLRVWGEPPSGDCWTVGIESPQHPDLDIVQVRLTDPANISAIATSGRNRRRWQTDRGPGHHLIDPTTGAWVEGRIETASALAAHATGADLAAKTLFISVSRQQPPLLGSASLGLTIDDRGAGTIWTTDGPHHAEIIPLVFHTRETG
jgi:thiamine biosynthesis lipoprotein